MSTTTTLMKRKETVLKYKGLISFENIGMLINELEKNKERYNIKLTLFKKLLALMIEILENVLKYSDKFSDFVDCYPEHHPEFYLKKEGDSFIMSMKNLIRIQDTIEVKARIDRINGMDETALKKFYRETITNGLFTEKGGAGLGFLEMAKIAEKPLRYKFNNLNLEYASFEIILKIRDLD